jgi:Ca2+-binding EF-hand superfamily protein
LAQSLSDGPVAEAFYSHFDSDGLGFVDFRHFVVGVAIATREADDDEHVGAIFEAINASGSSALHREELVEKLAVGLGRDAEQLVEAWFDRADVDGDGMISLEDFRVFMRRHPEFVELFRVAKANARGGEAGGSGEVARRLDFRA